MFEWRWVVVVLQVEDGCIDNITPKLQRGFNSNSMADSLPATL
jgi:hypothetical protein